MTEKPRCLCEDTWLVNERDYADKCEPEGPRYLVIDFNETWIRTFLLGTFCVCACEGTLVPVSINLRVCFLMTIGVWIM